MLKEILWLLFFVGAVAYSLATIDSVDPSMRWMKWAVLFVFLSWIGRIAFRLSRWRTRGARREQVEVGGGTEGDKSE